jgi:hypothetical protein
MGSLCSGGPLARQGGLSNLHLYDVYRFRTLGAFFDIEADCVTLGKGLESVALDGGIVDKYVIVLFGSDETEAL